MNIEPHVDENEPMWRKVAADVSIVAVFVGVVAAVVSSFMASC